MNSVFDLFPVSSVLFLSGEILSFLISSLFDLFLVSSVFDLFLVSSLFDLLLVSSVFDIFLVCSVFGFLLMGLFVLSPMCSSVFCG